MLACVISLRANGKARTKPICLWGYNCPSRHFQCLALKLSYINLICLGVVREVLVGGLLLLQ